MEIKAGTERQEKSSGHRRFRRNRFLWWSDPIPTPARRRRKKEVRCGAKEGKQSYATASGVVQTPSRDQKDGEKERSMCEGTMERVFGGLKSAENR